VTTPQQHGAAQDAAAAEPVLVSEQHGAVRVLRLNRPQARNALNPELVGALGAALVAAETDPDVRCVILTGTGDRAFCAGMDLRAFAAGNTPGPGAGAGAAGFARFTGGDLEVPVVGAANATAVAGGFELLACAFDYLGYGTSGRLREIAAPFVAAAPTGARVRTRLRVTAEDTAVLRAAGRHLGSLASADLAARCAEGRLDPQGKAVSRRERKRALTAQSSSRWAGAITRSSEHQRDLAERNLRAETATLRARVRKIEARLAVAAGGRRGRISGYATAAERHGKQQRLQALRACLAETE
jgi:hypothetical protein